MHLQILYKSYFRCASYVNHPIYKNVKIYTFSLRLTYVLSFLLQHDRRKWRSATTRTRRRSRWKLASLVVWNAWFDRRSQLPRSSGIVETFKSKEATRSLRRFLSRVVSKFIVTRLSKLVFPVANFSYPRWKYRSASNFLSQKRILYTVLLLRWRSCMKRCV